MSLCSELIPLQEQKQKQTDTATLPIPEAQLPIPSLPLHRGQEFPLVHCLCLLVSGLQRESSEKGVRWGWEHMCICKTGGFRLRTAPPQLSGQAVPARGCLAREVLAGLLWATGLVGRLTAEPCSGRDLCPLPDGPGLCCHGRPLVWVNRTLLSLPLQLTYTPTSPLSLSFLSGDQRLNY